MQYLFIRPLYWHNVMSYRFGNLRKLFKSKIVKFISNSRSLTIFPNEVQTLSPPLNFLTKSFFLTSFPLLCRYSNVFTNLHLPTVCARYNITFIFHIRKYPYTNIQRKKKIQIPYSIYPSRSSVFFSCKIT